MTYQVNRSLFNSPNLTTDSAINNFFAAQPLAIEPLPKEQIPHPKTHQTAAQNPLKGSTTNALLPDIEQNSASLPIERIDYPNDDYAQGNFEIIRGEKKLTNGTCYFKQSGTTLNGTMGWFAPVGAMILMQGQRERANLTETRKFTIYTDDSNLLYGYRVCFNKDQEKGTFFYNEEKDEIALWNGIRIRGENSAEIIVQDGATIGESHEI